MCRSLFWIKLQAVGLQFYLKETQTQVFSWEFCELLLNSLFAEQLWLITFKMSRNTINAELHIWRNENENKNIKTWCSQNDRIKLLLFLFSKYMYIFYENTLFPIFSILSLKMFLSCSYKKKLALKPLALFRFFSFPAGIYLLKVDNRNTRASVFIVNFDHISHLVLVFLLLTLNM